MAKRVMVILESGKPLTEYGSRMGFSAIMSDIYGNGCEVVSVENMADKWLVVVKKTKY